MIFITSSNSTYFLKLFTYKYIYIYKSYYKTIFICTMLLYFKEFYNQ